MSRFCNADLKTLEVTHNQIHTLPDDIGSLRHLECLFMRHNKLNNIPLLDGCTALKVSLFLALLCAVEVWLGVYCCSQVSVHWDIHIIQS